MAESDRKDVETAIQFPHVVVKGWGFERWFANDENANYCGKELSIIGGKRCSLHYHPIKHETFYVVRGKILVEFASPHPELEPGPDGPWSGGLEKLLSSKTLWPQDRFVVPPGLRHRFTAEQRDSTIIEVSTFHREDDVIRVIRGD